MRRRELLRLLLVAGVAGCTTGIEDPGTVAGSPVPGPRADGSRPAGTPSPTPSTPPSTSDEPEPRDDPDPPDGSTEERDPGSAPSSEEAPVGRGRTVVAVGRDALALPAPRDGGRSHTITGLAVHHTASPTAAASTAPGRFRGIARAHRELGWLDVAYHWGVDVAGNVYELRDETIAGDTRTDYDPAGWFLVVCEGDFEASAPPQAMLDALADVLAVGAERHGIDPSTIRGHRDLAATLCPGRQLQDRLPALREAVAARLAAGGVELRVDDDPDRVAAIEAGG